MDLNCDILINVTLGTLGSKPKLLKDSIFDNLQIFFNTLWDVPHLIRFANFTVNIIFCCCSFYILLDTCGISWFKSVRYYENIKSKWNIFVNHLNHYLEPRQKNAWSTLPPVLQVYWLIYTLCSASSSQKKSWIFYMNKNRASQFLVHGMSQQGDLEG